MEDKELLKLTPGELVDLGICPTCFNKKHNGALYGDNKDKLIYEDEDIVLNYERFQNGNDLWSKIYRYLKISGNDWVYLKGDYSASLRAANEFEKNQDFGFLNFNTNILPQTFSRNVRKIKFRNLIKKYFKSLFEK